MVTTVRPSPGDSPLPTGEFNDEIIAHSEIDPDTGEITINHRGSGQLTVTYDGDSRDPVIRRNGQVISSLDTNERILVRDTRCIQGQCFARSRIDVSTIFDTQFRYGVGAVPSLLSDHGGLYEVIDRSQARAGDQVAMVPESSVGRFQTFLAAHPDPSSYNADQRRTYNSFFDHFGTIISPTIMRQSNSLGSRFGVEFHNIDDLPYIMSYPQQYGNYVRFIRPNANLLASND